LRYKTNIQQLEDFLYTNKEHADKEIDSIHTKLKNRILGINLTKEFKGLHNEKIKNNEGRNYGRH
jgi:hypothetical protein